MFKCKTCGKEYRFKTTLNKHCREKHKPKEVIVIKPKGVVESDALASIRDMISDLCSELKTIKQQTAVVNNINNVSNVTNTINVYFNKDLRYYPELVKAVGRESACDLLLFTMPESKDLFGVLDKIFVKNGVSTCPIQLDDKNAFVVVRGAGEFVVDPTGELIDRENKNKLQDAVISAYMDSTKQYAEECEKIRRDRVNGDYTEKDMETINRRFDSEIEPSRPYKVIDIMNGIKPKKKDYDKLRRICSKQTA